MQLTGISRSQIGLSATKRTTTGHGLNSQWPIVTGRVERFDTLLTAADFLEPYFGCQQSTNEWMEVILSVQKMMIRQVHIKNDN